MAILLTIGWERARRARIGIRRSLWETIRAEGFGIVVFLVLVPIVVYTATYFRWFGEHGGYLDLAAIEEWWNLQFSMAKFSLTLASEHPYSSRPWSWPLLMRPVAYYYKDGSPPGTAAEILGMGNPAVFWGGTVALIIAAFYWLRSLGRRRMVQVTLWAAGTVAVAAGLVVLAKWQGSELNFLDGRELPYALFLFGTVFLAVAAVSRQERDWVPGFIAVAFFGQYLPWFGTFRTSFLFYMTPVTPFMVLAAVWSLKKMADVRLGPTRTRSLAPLAVAGVVLSVILFVWFFPILTGRTISQDQWHLRIWFAFPGWWNWI